MEIQGLGANAKHKSLTVPTGTDFLLPGDHAGHQLFVYMHTIYFSLVKTNRT